MTHDVARLLGPTGAASMAELSAQCSERSVRTWLRRGTLVALHPGVLARPVDQADWLVRAHAAVLHTGGQFSHISALGLWGLIDSRQSVLHVRVSPDRGLRSSPGLQVHRVRDLDRPYERHGLPVCSIDNALLDSWDLLHRRGSPVGARSLARPSVIKAVRIGNTSANRLIGRVSERPNLAGRRELSDLLTLVADGAQSELEIWGVLHVLRIPGLPKPVQQHRVRLPGRVVYLDAALPEAKLGIELDGAANHGRPEDRERDIARDAALAAVGWLVLRFSYRRLMDDPDGCRRDIVATYRRRLTTR